jgi:SAM-dependent methyltransferase
MAILNQDPTRYQVADDGIVVFIDTVEEFVGHLNRRVVRIAGKHYRLGEPRWWSCPALIRPAGMPFTKTADPARSSEDTKMHAQLPRFEIQLPARRTLERDHGHLSRLLRPGLSVLDVGCANGELTAGIAQAVAPDGEVVGVDRDAARLSLAASDYRGLANLRFEAGDVTGLDYHGRFDIVTAARLLQWVADPALAIAGMKDAAKSGGMLVVLDFNHARHEWEPQPPPEFSRFFQAFLAWRQANRWDNEMAGHLPALFQSAGLAGVESHVQDEIVTRGDPGFTERAALWSGAIDNLGVSMVSGGFLTETQLRESAECYGAWIRTGLEKQIPRMRTVTGVVPRRF